MAEQCGRGVPGIRVDELAWDDAVPEEGLSVCEVSIGLASVRAGVVPASLGEFFLGELFELAGF